MGDRGGTDTDDVGLGLSDLFTNTDYRTVSVSIPCYCYPRAAADGETSDRDELARAPIGDAGEGCCDGIVVQLSCSPSASTDYDLTGQILWPVSFLLGHYLVSSRGRSLISNQTVVELGAGCGLSGLVAAHFASRAVLTDGNDGAVLDLLRRNCEEFVPRFRGTPASSGASPALTAAPPQAGGEAVVARKLLWGDRSDLTSTLEAAGGRVDVVVAADVVQWPAVVEPLLHTVKALLWASRSDRPTFVLGLVERAASTSRLFFDLARRMGFVCARVGETSYLDGGIIPDLCLEPGRKTEVYEVVLSDRSNPPVLLGERSADRVLGDGFEHTTSMPC